jgi:hypothetical protein
MLEPLTQTASQLLPDAHVLFEVPCSAGVPDVVLLELDGDALASRSGTAMLHEPIDVRIMLALQASPAIPLTLRDLAAAVRVSPDHLRRRVLPRMTAGGHLEPLDGAWRAMYAFRSLARRVLTVEAKLRDWRGGLGQATRHTAVADEAWLILGSAGNAAAARAAWFAMYGVGLATLSTDGQLTKIVEPNVNRSRQPDRELLVERAVGLHLGGEVSGPLPQVFGTVPVASTGADPRLRGGAAR